MICFRDKTFCTFFTKCKDGSTCHSALTPLVNQGAERWWKTFNIDGKPPVCVFIDKPDCFKEKK